MKCKWFIDVIILYFFRIIGPDKTINKFYYFRFSTWRTTATRQNMELVHIEDVSLFCFSVFLAENKLITDKMKYINEHSSI